MTCESCVRDISSSLHKLSGIQKVEANLKDQLVSIEGTGASSLCVLCFTSCVFILLASYHWLSSLYPCFACCHHVCDLPMSCSCNLLNLEDHHACISSEIMRRISSGIGTTCCHYLVAMNFVLCSLEKRRVACLEAHLQTSFSIRHDFALKI